MPILTSFVVYEVFLLLSNYDLQNLMFVLKSCGITSKFNECQIGQLHLNLLVEVLPCPTRSMGTGECWRPCGALVHTVSFVCVLPPFSLEWLRDSFEGEYMCEWSQNAADRGTSVTAVVCTVCQCMIRQVGVMRLSLGKLPGIG